MSLWNCAIRKDHHLVGQEGTHIVENVTYALWEKTNIRSFTPNQKVESNQYDFSVLIYCFKAPKEKVVTGKLPERL